MVGTFAVKLDGFALAVTHWSERAGCRSRGPFASKPRSKLKLPREEARSGSKSREIAGGVVGWVPEVVVCWVVAKAGRGREGWIDVRVWNSSGGQRMTGEDKGGLLNRGRGGGWCGKAGSTRD